MAPKPQNQKKQQRDRNWTENETTLFAMIMSSEDDGFFACMRICPRLTEKLMFLLYILMFKNCYKLLMFNNYLRLITSVEIFSAENLCCDLCKVK